MVNGAFNLAATARDLCVERGDPRLQLGDRQGVEVLAHELRHQIGGPGRKIVRFHAAQR